MSNQPTALLIVPELEIANFHGAETIVSSPSSTENLRCDVLKNEGGRLELKYSHLEEFLVGRRSKVDVKIKILVMCWNLDPSTN